MYLIKLLLSFLEREIDVPLKVLISFFRPYIDVCLKVPSKFRRNLDRCISSSSLQIS